MPRAKLSDDRAALLRRMWPDGRYSVPEIHQAFNALPGTRYVNAQSLYEAAHRLGLPRKRPPPPGGARRGGREPARDPAKVLTGLSNRPRPVDEEDRLEAEAMLDSGRSVADLAEWFGWDLARAREVARAWAEARRAAVALPEAAQ